MLLATITMLRQTSRISACPSSAMGYAHHHDQLAFDLPSLVGKLLTLLAIIMQSWPKPFADGR